MDILFLYKIFLRYSVRDMFRKIDRYFGTSGHEQTSNQPDVNSIRSNLTNQNILMFHSHVTHLYSLQDTAIKSNQIMTHE